MIDEVVKGIQQQSASTEKLKTNVIQSRPAGLLQSLVVSVTRGEGIHIQTDMERVAALNLEAFFNIIKVRSGG